MIYITIICESKNYIVSIVVVNGIIYVVVYESSCLLIKLSSTQ